MARSNDNAYWSTDAGWRTASNTQFERIGVPGQYHSAITWTGGLLALTGSKYGYGAILISGSAIDGVVTIAGGDAISLANIEKNRLLPFGVSELSGSASAGGAVYLFKRQQ